MDFVIFDTEYVMDKGQDEPGYNGPVNMEVIQIAALKINADLQVVDVLNLYVKTKFHPVVRPYFEDVTKISNDAVQGGLDFPGAYARFKEFVGDLPVYSHGWGGAESDICDGEVLNETMRYHDMADDNPPKYKNIAEYFAAQYARAGMNVKTQTSGQIAGIVGRENEIVKLGLTPHNALYDVYSILVGLRHFGFSFS